MVLTGSALYIGISFQVQKRWQEESAREFRKLKKKIIRCCIAVAGAHSPSYGPSALSTLEGLISQAARTKLPDIQIINATDQKFGAGCDKPDKKVRHVRSWEHGGRDEFHTCIDDTGSCPTWR